MSMKPRLKINSDQSRRLYNSLRELTQVFESGENYTVINPYARREVKQAMEVLAEIQGVKDYLSAKTN